MHKRTSIYTFVNINSIELGLINTETDELVQISLESLKDYPGGKPQHSWITPDAKTIYVSVDASPPNAAAVIVINVERVKWSQGQADLTIEKVLILEPPGTPSTYPPVQQVEPKFPIASWTIREFTQAHGPTFLPDSFYTYVTQWTDNRIRVIDRRSNDLLAFEPFVFGQKSLQTHGVNFNPSGTLALGTGYFYDNNEIDVYSVNKSTGRLYYEYSIELQGKYGYAAFTHYTLWLNNRYALTAAMQLGPTSFTLPSQEILGQSVWLLDVVSQDAQQIIGPAKKAEARGIFRSPSDLTVAGNKLYVAEEDSLGETFGRDGYVSVFDISNLYRPEFIKRFQPGEELPADFAVAHGISVTPDERNVYVASYASNYIIKIDTLQDQVVKVYNAKDGLDAPHGGFMTGQYR